MHLPKEHVLNLHANGVSIPCLQYSHILELKKGIIMYAQRDNIPKFIRLPHL